MWVCCVRFLGAEPGSLAGLALGCAAGWGPILRGRSAAAPIQPAPSALWGSRVCVCPPVSPCRCSPSSFMEPGWQSCFPEPSAVQQSWGCGCSGALSALPNFKQYLPSTWDGKGYVGGYERAFLSPCLYEMPPYPPGPVNKTSQHTERPGRSCRSSGGPRVVIFYKNVQVLFEACFMTPA